MSKIGGDRGGRKRHKTIKPPEKQRVIYNDSGVGGNRTLVHTSNRRAFYMFSFQLIFENTLTENSPCIP